jgi:hypothetical protein
MARNGSGTMSILNSFSSGTTISSTAMNANNTDIASEITGSLPRNGEAAMTGQLKSASGSVAAPGVTFSADLDCGYYRIGADNIGFSIGGVKLWDLGSAAATLTGTLTATTVAASSAMTKGGVSVEAFASGTVMLFAQTSAPTGWTKGSTHNDKALRVVTGTASSGGSVAFTTAFASQTPAGTVGDTALTEAQLASHKHFAYADVEGGGSTVTASNQAGVFRQVSADSDYTIRGSATAATLGLSSATGSGATHTHTFTGNAINLAVNYVDVILATKD